MRNNDKTQSRPNSLKYRRFVDTSGSNNGMYGKTHSDEWKENRSILYSGSGNPMYGKPHPNKGKKIFNQSDKTKQHLSNLAKNRSEEYRLKLSRARRGKPSPFKGDSAPRVCCVLCKKETDIRNLKKYHKHDGIKIKNPPALCSCVKCHKQINVRSFPRHKCITNKMNKKEIERIKVMLSEDGHHL